jgi:hypothetical protein
MSAKSVSGPFTGAVESRREGPGAGEAGIEGAGRDLPGERHAEDREAGGAADDDDPPGCVRRVAR